MGVILVNTCGFLNSSVIVLSQLLLFCFWDDFNILCLFFKIVSSIR